jgi:hypothetical protein
MGKNDEKKQAKASELSMTERAQKQLQARYSMNLKNVSDEVLKAELEERERKKKADAMPKPLPKPDWSRLEKFIIDGVKQVADEGREPKDFDHYVYEEALMVVFGRKIWDWYNKTLKE